MYYNSFESNSIDCHPDVLNRFPDLQDKQQTIHIMRHIFPRQYGLHNVFTSKVDPRETSVPFKDYTLREKDISAAMSRALSEEVSNPAQVARWKSHVPKRLRGEAIALVEKMRKLNKRCSYVELLRHYCPVEVTTSERAISTTGILTRIPGSAPIIQAGVEKKHIAAGGEPSTGRN